jgi:hypothetical protein
MGRVRETRKVEGVHRRRRGIGSDFAFNRNKEEKAERDKKCAAGRYLLTTANK